MYIEVEINEMNGDGWEKLQKPGGWGGGERRKRGEAMGEEKLVRFFKSDPKCLSTRRGG